MFIQDVADLPSPSSLPKRITIDTEQKEDGSPEGYSVAWSLHFDGNREIDSFYVPINHKFSVKSDKHNMDFDYVKKWLQDACKDRRLTFHNAQYDLMILERNYDIQVPIENVEDTMLMHYTLDTNRLHGLKPIRKKEYGRDHLMTYKEAKKAGTKSFVVYGEDDAIETEMLYVDLLMQYAVHSKAYKLYKKYEIPYVQVMQEMNYRHNYIRIDEPLLSDYVEKLRIEKELVLDLLKEAFEADINFNSTKQLGALLVEKGFKLKQKPATGNYITDEKALTALYNRHKSLALEVLMYNRGTEKLDNTYVSKLYNLLEQIDDEVFILSGYQFKHIGTETGRLSSVDPNLQNIPRDSVVMKLTLLKYLQSEGIVDYKRKFLTDEQLKKLKEGKHSDIVNEAVEKFSVDLRKIFISMPGKVFIGADYSQLELRMMAHLSGDKNMIEAYCADDADFHQATADGINEIVGYELVTRQDAKTINFFFQYGGYYKTLAKTLGISIADALAIDVAYSKKFRRRAEFIKEIHQSARRSHFVQTILGRRRNMHTAGINSDVWWMANHAENASVSTVISGSSADLIKIAMINLMKYKKDVCLKLQIHDELVYEVDIELADKYKQLISYEMENAMKLKVPLAVDAKVGMSWRDVH